MESEVTILACAHCRVRPVCMHKNRPGLYCSNACAKKALWEQRRRGEASVGPGFTPRLTVETGAPALMSVRTCSACREHFERPLEGPGSQRLKCERCLTYRKGYRRVGDTFRRLEDMSRDEVFAWKADKKEPWFYARITIQKHARERYQASDKPKACVVCGWSDHIEVAHIRGAMSFPGDTPIGVINSLDNLIALCPNHHWCYDAGKLSAEDLEKFKGPGRIG